MKHIDAAMVRLKEKKSVNENDLSLIERVLASENNPKTAYILALDLILVGIDTVSKKNIRKKRIEKLFCYITNKITCLSDINGSLFYSISISNKARRTTKNV